MERRRRNGNNTSHKKINSIKDLMGNKMDTQLPTPTKQY
jgi:hypothetical protein